MNIKVWSNFSKRRNSTKQPTGGTTVSCVLKETTSIEKPTFVFASNDFSINYVEAFGHYYFVDDIKSVRNNIIEVSCSQDVLATYKSSITGSSQYVERANISGYIPRIADALNPPTNDIEIKQTDILDTDLDGFATPYYILGTVSDTGVSYYALTESRLATLLGNVFNSSFFQNWSNQFYGLRECIVSLKKVPFKPTGTAVNVHIGEYDTQDPGDLIAPQTYSYKSANVLINRPSDDHESGTSYLDSSPYSIGCVYLPYVGIVPIDMDIIGDTRYLTVEMWLDHQTADIVYLLSTSGKKIASYSGNCAASMPIASQGYNAVGVVGGLLSVVGGVISENSALATAGVLNTVRECSLHSQVNGVLSSFISGHMGEWVQAFVVTRVPIDWNLDINKTRCGLPINKTMSLSSMSGYVKCRSASVDIPGFEEDKEAIQDFMNSGFYIE